MNSTEYNIAVPEQKQDDSIAKSPGRWMECLSHLDPRFGGLSTVVPQLGSSLAAQHGFQIDVAAFSATDETDALKQHAGLRGSHWPCSRAAWLKDRNLRTNFRQAVTDVDGVHIHGIWETHAAVGARIARSAGRPYVVSAHGMLQPWALEQKRLKKKLYARLIERENLNQAACLHALTRAEIEDYRRFGCTRPIAVIPNAVDIPRSVDGSLFLNSFPGLRDQRLVIFLGRLHPKKGLELLIRAWEEAASQAPDATLVLAGPDEANYRARLEALVEKHHLSSRVSFVGMLDSSMKWSALASAHCFVLPSYSEGLSVAVLEAMGIGLPVIVSQQCYLPEVAEAEAGWVIQPEQHELSETLSMMLRNSAAQNREIGNRGRLLVHRRFSWPVISKQMAELYTWAANGTRPQSFEFMEVSA